jgi:hypothetical protein
MGVGRGANTPYPVKKKMVEKPPRNSTGFCGGGQGLSWAVDPRGGGGGGEEEEEEYLHRMSLKAEIIAGCFSPLANM